MSLLNRRLRRSGSKRLVSSEAAQKLYRAVAMVDPLERRVMLSYTPSGSTPNNGVLAGDGTTGEKLTIDATPAGLLEWNDGSGFNVFWGPGVTVAASATSTVTINTVGTGQQLVIGTPAYPASTLGALFVLNSDSSAGDTTTIDDSYGTETADAVSHPYAIDLNNAATNFSINGPGIRFQEPNGSSQGGIFLKGSEANDTYDVYSTYFDPDVPGEEPFTIVAGSGTNAVNIGDDPSNLTAIVGNINGTVHVTDPTGTTDLTINDQGDNTNTTATITNDSVTGLSPAPIDYVSVSPMSAAGTGVTSLTVLGGPGPVNGIAYTIQSTDATTPLTLTTDGLNDTVLISNDDSVAGIDGNISINDQNTTPGHIALTIDASADTNGAVATLSGAAGEVTLTGLTPDGSTISYPINSTPTLSGLVIDNTSGKDLFTVDFTNGNPIPPLSVGSGFYYNGGGGSSSSLVLSGGTFDTEIDNADSPGVGDVTWTGGGASTYLNYTGLTPIADNTTAATYTFNDNASPDSSFAIQNGTLGLIPDPSLEFASSGSGFETTDVNNKASVKFDDPGSASTGGTLDVTATPTGLTTFNVTIAAGASDLYAESFPSAVTSSFNLGGNSATAEVYGPGLATGTTVGDGGPSGATNTLTYDAAGNPVSETFGPAIYETMITQGSSTLDAKRFKTVDIINAPAPAITFGAATTLTAIEGASTGDVTVGSFTVPGTTAVIANFTAVINWGDSTYSAGTIVQNPFNLSQFYVHGTHIFAEAGSYSPVIHVSYNGTTTSTTDSNGVTLNVTIAAGKVSSQTESATVNDAPLVGEALPIVASEGVDTGVVPMASFSDTGGAQPAVDYTATINYGDGTPAQPATSIVLTGANFVVNGDHTYLKSGLFTTTITITDNYGMGGTTLVVGSLAHVAAPTVVVSAVGANFNAVEGKSYTGPVATITDSDTLTPSSAFVAHISWGDGTFSTGMVTGSDGNYTVTGPHTYAEYGTYNVSVTVTYNGGASSQTVYEQAIVSDPSVLGKTVAEINSTEGFTTGTVTVATFTDPGGAESLSHYSAKIVWGDGSTSTGTISYNSSTKIFSVTGSHVFKDEGEYTGSVTIDHDVSTPTVVSLKNSVSEAPLIGYAITNLKATHGVTFTNLTLGTVDNTDVYETSTTGYTGSIKWGDGTTTTLTSANLKYNASTKLYSILGTHKYASKGSYTITVTMTDSPLSAVFNSKITVS